MHFTPVPLWLMIVSTTMAVLPVPPVADDQLALAAPDRIMASIALIPVCRGSLHRLTLHHRRGLDLEQTALGGVDRALAVERGRPEGR